MQAIETFDEAKAKSLVCQSKRAWVENSLSAFGNPARLDETFAIRFENLSYQQVRTEEDLVVILVQGQMWISFLGQEETQEINEKHTLIKQGGRWLICDP